MLIARFVFARLDYCYTMFTGLPRCDHDRLQAVHNAAVKLILGAIKFDHVTSLYRERHWLLVEHRVIFKMAVMTYKCVHSATTDYIQSPVSAAYDGTALLVCTLFKDRRQGLVFCIGWTSLVEQSTCLRHISMFPAWPSSKNN